MKIDLLGTEEILKINKMVCQRENQSSICMNRDKVESALAAAYYPGDYPFIYGGIAKVAGALSYFLLKAHAFMDGNKRTAAVAFITLMETNGYTLRYAIEVETNFNAFADVLDKAAASTISKEDLINWYDQHKVNLNFG